MVGREARGAWPRQDALGRGHRHVPDTYYNLHPWSTLQLHHLPLGLCRPFTSMFTVHRSPFPVLPPFSTLQPQPSILHPSTATLHPRQPNSTESLTSCVLGPRCPASLNTGPWVGFGYSMDLLSQDRTRQDRTGQDYCLLHGFIVS